MRTRRSFRRKPKTKYTNIYTTRKKIHPSIYCDTTTCMHSFNIMLNSNSQQIKDTARKKGRRVTNKKRRNSRRRLFFFLFFFVVVDDGTAKMNENKNHHIHRIEFCGSARSCKKYYRTWIEWNTKHGQHRLCIRIRICMCMCIWYEKRLQREEERVESKTHKHTLTHRIMRRYRNETEWSSH